MRQELSEAEELTLLRRVAQRTTAIAAKARAPGAAPARRQPTPAEVLAAVRQVSAYAAKLAARAQARQRRDDVREVAETLERCAATIDRCQLSGADRLREAAARYARVAEDLAAALKG